MDCPKFRFEIAESLPSTSSELFLRSDSIHGLFLAARQQTSGQGRRGRQWHTFPGNLAASLGLELPLDFPASRLPIWAGISVYDFLSERLSPSERTHLQLKWPNDVVAGVENKKICGILSQVRVMGNWQKLALGIGINLAKAPEGEGIWATSLPALGADPIGLEQALSRLLVLFQQHWSLLENAEKLNEAWESRTKCIGAWIRYGDIGKPESMLLAKVIGLGENGSLRVLGEGESEPRNLLSDDISLRF